MKTGVRPIESGSQYNHLFPQPEGENVRIKKRAELEDTVSLMKRVIRQTLPDTSKVANLLQSGTIKQTLANVWDFCFRHLQYRRDAENIEQVRRPARTWRDRKQGVDCDCMTVFIGSILMNLGIRFKIRLSRNSMSAAGFEHVYPVAITNQGNVIMDCVVHQFNYEAPYLEIKDIDMELQYLNGFDDDEFDDYEEVDGIEGNDDEDFEDENDYDDLEGLAGKAKRQARKAARKAKRASKPPLKQRIKNGIQKGLHVINRVNPATALLRAGILASLKLNLMKVAGKLRYTYWSDADAQRNNVDMDKFHKLKQIREKIEKVFFGAGGKPENMKKAILTGRGNRDKAVALNGLGYEPIYDESNIRSVIGDDIYLDEFDSVQHPRGINGLGSIAAGSAIAAASGIIGTIAGLIKKLGSMFKKGSPQEQQDILQDNTSATEEKSLPYSNEEITNYLDEANAALAPDPIAPSVLPAVKRSAPLVPAAIQAKESAPEESDSDPVDLTELDAGQSAMKSATNDTTKPKSNTGGVWQWIKNHPVITIGIATAVVGGTVLVVKAVKKSKGKTKKTSSVNGLDGLDGVKRRTTRSAKTKRVTTTRRSSPKRRTGVRRHTRIKKVELL